MASCSLYSEQMRVISQISITIYSRNRCVLAERNLRYASRAHYLLLSRRGYVAAIPRSRSQPGVPLIEECVATT